MWASSPETSTNKDRQYSSLRSEQRHGIWNECQGELSPDSRALFDDLEEAERENKRAGKINLNQESFGQISSSHSSRRDYSDFTPNLKTSCVADSEVMSAPRFRDVTPPAPGDRRCQRLSFSSATPFSDHTSSHQDNHVASEVGALTRETHELSFISASDINGSRDSLGGFGLHNTHDEEKEEEDDDELDESRELTQEEREMLESEALARQLMEEEEEMLLQRIAQEQMRVLAAMRSDTEGNGDGDLGVAVRMAEEEQQLHENGMDTEGFDPDDLSYDQLLELSDRIGDVRQERWRNIASEHVEKLETVSFHTLTSQHVTCVVCQYDFVSEDVVKRLPCSHIFHSDCINPWLADHDTCVTCKKSIVLQSPSSKSSSPRLQQ